MLSIRLQKTVQSGFGLQKSGSQATKARSSVPSVRSGSAPRAFTRSYKLSDKSAADKEVVHKRVKSLSYVMRGTLCDPTPF